MTAKSDNTNGAFPNDDTLKRIQELEAELEEALQKNAELEQKLSASQEKEMRLFADVQNVRRRMDEERSALVFESGKKILGSLILILDNFHRALENLPSDLKGNEWAKGVAAIQKQMDDFLKKEGVEEIAETGVELDPNLHEAVMTDPEGEQGKVTRILTKGYRYMDRVLRHAQVAVGS